MNDKKLNFDEKLFFPAKICFGEELFPPLLKAKNQHKNFESIKKDAPEDFQMFGTQFIFETNQVFGVRIVKKNL